MMRLQQMALAAAGGLTLIACSSSEPKAPVCSVTQVTVSPSTGSLQMGQSLSLSGSLSQTNCNPVPALSWSTSNTAVATVSATGDVTGVSAGSATVTAAAAGRSATAEITVVPIPVATVTATISSAEIGLDGTATASAQTLSAAGATLSGRAVAWSSSDPTVATVNGAGLVTPVAPGTANINAVSEGVTGSVSLVVVPAIESKRFAYVWAHAASATVLTPYTPDADYSHNAAGGTNRVMRAGPGQYQVTFGRMAKRGTITRETLLASSYGSTGQHCVVGGWGNATIDLVVDVICYSNANVLADAPFTLLLVGSNTLSGKYGFTYNPANTSTNEGHPSYQFTSGTGTISHAYNSTGSYMVQFGLSALAKSNVHVSAYGGSARCRVVNWSDDDGWASVYCAQGASASDNNYDALMLDAGRPGKRWGYVWTDVPAAAINSPYVPELRYQRQSNGQQVTVTRTGVGSYRVSFPGLAKPDGATETFIVTPYGVITKCQINGWGNNSANTAIEVSVSCRDALGNLANGAFSVLFLE